ncbi:hypothetical protein GCK32_021600, partial [Trichostrongylus colubriformis]
KQTRTSLFLMHVIPSFWKSSMQELLSC